MQLSAAVYLLLLASSAQDLIFWWNFVEIPVFFFVFAVNREKKFQYFLVYFVSKFKNSKKCKKYDKNMIKN